MPDALPPVATTSDPNARIIGLVRGPVSPQAAELVRQVDALMVAQMPGGRTGAGTVATRQEHLGVILAGLLRAAWKGHAVAAGRRPGHPMWKRAKPGHMVFWAQVDALEAAGLVRTTAGIQFFNVGTGRPDGHPAQIKATPALLDLADRCGVTGETTARDWALTAHACSIRLALPDPDLIRVVAPPARGSRGGSRALCELPDEQRAGAERAREQVRQLNACLAKVGTAGMVPPVLYRQFEGDLRSYGRFHAIGAENYQTAPRRERAHWRLGGAPVAEVDLKASCLSVVLALNGQPIPQDPYAHDALSALPRDVVKEWVIQSLNSGGAKRTWAVATPPAIAAHALGPIRQAALAEYPALTDLRTLLPADLAALVPPAQQARAVGLFLMGLEAQVLSGALQRLLDDGLVALPLHDALFVPEEATKAAQRALEEAFEGLLGARPQVSVKGPRPVPQLNALSHK